MEMSGQLHVTAVLSPRKSNITKLVGGQVGLRGRLDDVDKLPGIETWPSTICPVAIRLSAVFQNYVK
jgi:hypothetical protein